MPSFLVKQQRQFRHSCAAASKSDATLWERFQVLRDQTRLIQKKPSGQQYHNSLIERHNIRGKSKSKEGSGSDASSSSWSDGSSCCFQTRKLPSILKTATRSQTQSDNSNTSLGKRKKVRFSCANIYYHESTLGDHPMAKHGPPITLRWEAWSHECLDLNIGGFVAAAAMMIMDRQHPRRRTAEERRQIVLRTHSERDMRRADRECRRIREQRYAEYRVYLGERTLFDLQRGLLAACAYEYQD